MYYLKRNKLYGNFNKTPVVKVNGFNESCFVGWDNIFKELTKAIQSNKNSKKVIVFELYQGVYYDDLLNQIKQNLNFDYVYDSANYILSEEKIQNITFPDVTDHRIFGFLTRLNMIDFFDHEKLEIAQKEIENKTNGNILVFGYGASLLFPKPDILIYADMARWEIQLRMRKNEVNNLGVQNANEGFEAKYKRGFFVDWRVCDRHKKTLMDKWDYVLDTNIHDNPKMITGDTLSAGLSQVVNQPFSVVPYFDPGIWGGQWMKEVCGLDKEKDNFAWCFNCVPEENSLFLKFGNAIFETPSINAVFYKSVELLGDPVHARFGDEFPIRFDFLDTMDGGNLSLQVHPLTEYIQEHFGIHYTQDESYYILDAEDDAMVYLGLKENIDSEEMIHDLLEAEAKGVHFDDTKYVEKWPAKKHDHFLIPGGTVHCSGKNTMVLEISSTPYIFTFKLWDWGRVADDGMPRPINIDHGKNVIQWDRTTKWAKENLINKFEAVDKGDGWKEEKTGLHKREFIETRRHWFSKKVLHKTNDSVNVLNLVEGAEAIVESPSNQFEPFIVHYAETFIVPANVKEYTIRPYGESEGKEIATIKAYIRY